MKMIDTNIIAYAYDEFEIKKREKCKDLIGRAFNENIEFCVTNQILGELFNTLTENFRKPVSVENAEIIVNSIIDSDNWLKINYSYKTVGRAISLFKKYKVHFWDALIAATMIENDISVIYTENEKDFKKIPGLEIVNPLA